MKNIIKSLLLGAVTVMPLFMASCSTDTDSNPTFEEPTSFVLNTPANAANNIYDLAQCNSVTLTTSQPNYGGMPLATQYAVQVSIDPNFASVDPSVAEPEGIAYQELTDVYTTAAMNVNASQLNDAVVALYVEQSGGQYPSDVLPIYIRLRAWVPGGTASNVAHGTVYSNVITLPKVKATYVAPAITLPTKFFICGSSIGTAWQTWKAMAPVYGMEGQFYTMIYSDGSAQFKFGEYEQQWLGYSNVKTINDDAGAGVQEAASDNNIAITTPGWFVLYVTTKINGSLIDYTFNFEPAAAGVIGSAFDPSWSGVLMDVPTSNTEWVSPAATGAGEMRAYIKVPGIDWWRTEFTFYQGSCYWRTVDIQSSWEDNVGADYSVKVTAGQKVHVNFDSNTGSVQ